MAYYVATDLHGNYDIWSKIRDFLKEDDYLFYLGDAIDRGPRGWEIMVELIEHPRVIYIKGNHEDMMYNAFTVKGPAAEAWHIEWEKNGGKATKENIESLGVTYYDMRHYLDEIAYMPAWYRIEINDKEYYLSHAGFTPTKEFFKLNDGDREIKNMWDRKHIFDEWTDEMDVDKVIHGHTPIANCLLAQDFIDNIISDYPFVYADGHKINLDMGTADSNMALLYNLSEDKVEFIIKGV